MASKFIANPPNNLEMQDFLAHSQKSGGLAKSARFIVRFPNRILDGGIQDLSYLCEAAEFPGRQFMHSGYRYYGPEFKMPHQTVYDDLNLTFLVRENFGEREFFDDWMMKINPISTYDFNYRANYATTIEIFQMSEYGSSDLVNLAQYKINFEKAWPIAIQAMPVTWADDNYHRLVVSFSYTRWYRSAAEISSNSFNIATGESLNLAAEAPPPVASSAPAGPTATSNSPTPPTTAPGGMGGPDSGRRLGAESRQKIGQDMADWLKTEEGYIYRKNQQQRDKEARTPAPKL